MAFHTLEDAVFNCSSLADPVDYVTQSGYPDELFNNRHGGRIGLLHVMVMEKSKPGVEVMLDIGADPNLRSSNGLTPLSMANTLDNLEIVQLLVERGADVNARDEQGDTPLHWALTGGREEIAQYLLDHGADPDARNQLGISPRQIKLFQKLRAAVPQAPPGGGGLDTWLDAFGDEPSEQTLVIFLKMCQTLLDNKVREGSMSHVKAQIFQRKIDEFMKVLAWPETTVGAHAAKIKRMREIIDELKAAFTEDLTR